MMSSPEPPVIESLPVPAAIVLSPVPPSMMSLP
jgi:hypothetical protein